MILEIDVRSNAAQQAHAGAMPRGTELSPPTPTPTREFGPVSASVVALDAGQPDGPVPLDTGQLSRVVLALCLSGAVEVGQDGSGTVVREGQLTCVDGTRPHRVVARAASRLVVVRAEHHRLGLLPERTCGLTANAWSADGVVYALIADTLACLAGDLNRLTDTDGNALGLMIIDLIGCLFVDQLRGRAVEPTDGRQLLLLKVLCHVRGRLGDPALMPERIARHFGISLRYLQVLFAELGTSPARWIRDERLSRLRDDLADPGLDHLAVSVLGEKWGIPGASQVSRLFRAAYGSTPSDFRRERAERAFADRAVGLRPENITDPRVVLMSSSG